MAYGTTIFVQNYYLGDTYMKLLHLGDLHLGKSLLDFGFKDDQKYILNQILSIVEDKKIDAVLLAGDIYDRAIPSEDATWLLDYFLSSLVKLDVSVYMISGNHDSDERLNFGSSLFKSNKVYISSKFDGTLHKNTEKDDFGEIDIYLLPFVKASQVESFYPEEHLKSYEAAVRTIIDNTDIDTNKRNVILAHQFVVNSNSDPVVSGSEGVSVKTVGLVEKISYKCFDEFDYVALGHIHSGQSVGRETVRYSGSPLKYSLSEADSCKSVPIITLGEKNVKSDNKETNVEVELVPLKPLRDLRHLKGKMKDLLDKNNITSPEDYVTLTDEDPIENAMALFQQEYPYTVRIEYDNSYTKEVDSDSGAVNAEDKSFSELIGDFYEMMYGQKISEEEMQYMMVAAKEAGIDETN